MNGWTCFIFLFGFHMSLNKFPPEKFCDCVLELWSFSNSGNVAIPSTPQVKWRQGNVYANLTLIVFHDVPLLRKKKNIMTVYWLTPFVNSFLTRELCACARASCKYDVAWSIPVNLFFYFRLLSAFDSFWQVINKQNGNLYC